jgi:FMN phosphatase YigB (HAD superfamily)
MPDKPRKADEEALENLMNELADGVLEMSDEEILAQVREARENPDAAARRVAEIVQRAITTRGQRKREEARREYEAVIAAMQTRTYRLPDDPQERRALLELVVRRNPRVRSAVTLQHRDLTSLSDADVESQLRKLQEVGFLDANGKPVDEEK